MFPRFRFTLSNAIEGSLVISEPGGWDSAKFKLERNEEFHSLVEFYDQPLTFYGQDISANGGIIYIRNIEQTQGIDAQVGILVEISEDGGDTYETAYNGLLSIQTAKEIDFYKLEMGVIRNDFWQKFINRKLTPIDLSASVDLDGNARTPISPITLRLPSQIITLNSMYEGGNFVAQSETAVTTSGGFVQIGLEPTLTEIDNTYTLPVSLVSSSLAVTPLLNLVFVGDVQITVNGSIRVTASATVDIDGVSVDISTRRNTESQVGIDGATIPIGAGTCDTTIPISGTHTFSSNSVGDDIRIFGGVSFALSSSGNISWTFEFDLVIEITQLSTFPESETEAFIIKDALKSILSKSIGADNVLTSDYLDSCGGLYAIMKGLHVRGYPLADKPFALSFDDWWKGVEPILNLGLGYETSPNKIRVEPKSYFYDKSPSINFDFVNNIERSYDIDSVFKLIEIGYNKWSAESDSGIDDPQTKRTYNTLFKTVGKEIKILSQFIAASLAIEQTRRNRVEEGKDWRLDEDVMIIALKETSPYEPELDENFTSVTNLLNADTRYNIRLSVARNFERWKSYFNGCLQWYLSEEYMFASGEGNYDMTSTLSNSDCEASDVSPEPSLSEKQDIEITGDYLFKPIIYSFEHPLTFGDYKTIRDNPTKAIGISRTDSDHVTCFIKVLEYEITHGKGTFELYLADDEYL